jgi:hypothetical protein
MDADQFTGREARLAVLSDALALRGHESLQRMEDGCQSRDVAASRQNEAQGSGRRGSHGCHEQPKERWQCFDSVPCPLLM